MKPDTGRPSEDAVKSLVKVVSILDAFSTSRRSLSLAEISAATGFPRSTRTGWRPRCAMSACSTRTATAIAIGSG